ncbi:srs domain-containing protein [Cystoisospora suis]|uniref:Srs domain-containing protein n=1 Tax=Cystoisospora suis TaxID=483139 RepID=A0A2C6KM87_9APIC|nr:srs domain-containing protein [Cystoisospora suis]
MRIAMASGKACYVGRSLRRASGKRPMAKQNLWLLACAAASILLLSPSACALRHREGTSLQGNQDGPSSQATEATNAVCPAAEKAAEYTATLSESNQKVSLQCAAAGDQVVPAGLKDGSVCPADVQTLAACETPAENSVKASASKAVSLSVLMGGTEAPPVTWVESTLTEADGPKKYELSLPNAPLPLKDTKFVAGCIPAKKEKANNECKLTVTVEARKSAAAGQTVYCAYGAKSNEAKPTVTMTQENNTLTLVCGNEATKAVPQPTDYKTAYCADEVGAECKTETFTSFIPGFQSTWWTENKGAQNVTLKIPPEHFPDSPKTIHLGCLYTPPTTPQDQSAGAAKQNLCKVDVVIGAKESSATGRRVAALPGLAVGAVALSISFLIWF